MADREDSKGGDRANIAHNGNGPRPPDSTRRPVEVPADLWKTLTEAVSNSGFTDASDVEDAILAIRGALIVGLGSTGEVSRVRANIEAARERRGFTLDSDFVPKYFASFGDGEAMGEFSSAFAYLDTLRESGLRTVAAYRAARGAKQAART